jgi:hypothetical protein
VLLPDEERVAGVSVDFTVRPDRLVIRRLDFVRRRPDMAPVSGQAPLAAGPAPALSTELSYDIDCVRTSARRVPYYSLLIDRWCKYTGQLKPAQRVHHRTDPPTHNRVLIPPVFPGFKYAARRGVHLC